MLALAAAALVSLAAALALDPVFGLATFEVLVLGLLLYHLRRLSLLRRWLDRDASGEPPRAHGAWDELHAALMRPKRDAARREAELARAVESWREAAQALPDGVLILEGERIAWCNDHAAEHLGIDPARDVGHAVTHLVRIPEFAAYLQAGDYGHPLEMAAPGSEAILSLRAIRYGAGQRLILTRDVTRLHQVERVRREFVANVSHELRTPLTVIAGFLETLRDEPDAGAAQRYIAMMAEQAARMQRLVEDLLTLSALESSPAPALEEAIDVAQLMERLAREARVLSGGRHHIEAESEAGLALLGSEKELSSAFGNLVSNAIRYTPEGGTVRLAWHRSEDGAAFVVEDTGIGIAPEHLSRLTERFYRVDRGRSRESGGTGLGLAIVKHALARHGATLEVSSTPGKGSRFSAKFAGPRVRGRCAGH